MRARPLALGLVPSLCVMVALLSAAVPAQAFVAHKYDSQLTGFTGFNDSGGMLAVDASSDLYVADSGNKTVYRFNAAGAPLNFSASETYVEGSKLTGTPSGGFSDPAGVAVDDATGEVYVVDREAGAVDVFSSAGEYLFQITGTPSGPFYAPTAVAVDDVTEQVFVAARNQNAIDVFSSTGKYVSQFGSASPESVAVNDLTGDIYVGETAIGLAQVSVFSSLGGLIPPVWEGAQAPAGNFDREGFNRIALGLDPGTGNVSVADEAHHVIDEFESSSSEEYAAQVAGTPAGPFTQPVAVAAAPNGTLYVADGEEGGVGDVDVFEPLVLPDVKVNSVSELKARSATLSGTVNPDEAGEATCEFELGTSSSYGQRLPCPAHVANGNAAASVEVHASGLQPGTIYYYRLDATNGNGTHIGAGPKGSGQFRTPGAVVSEVAVSDIAGTSATVEAQINPGGVATSYYVQYSTIDTAECPTSHSSCMDFPLAPGEGIGSGDVNQAVSAHIQGLAAYTTYHYSVVAINVVNGEEITAESPDQTFTTQRAGTELALLDNRQWEMVSPLNKHGGLIYPYGEVLNQAAADGSAFTYESSRPGENNPQGNGNLAQELARRGTDGGWSTLDLSANHAVADTATVGEGQEYRFFSSELTLGVLQPFGLYTQLSPEATEQTPFLRTDYHPGESGDCVTGCFKPLLTGAPGYADVSPGTVFGGPANGCPPDSVCGPQFKDATPDGEHVVIFSGVELLTGGGQWYEWSKDLPPSEQLQPLYPLPHGAGVVGGEVPGPITHQLSNDGSVFFNANGHLYLHEAAKDETVQVHVAPGAGSEGEPGFEYASSDGSRLFFYDSEHLTNAPEGGVYECELVEVGGEPTCTGLALTGLTFEGALVGGGEEGTDFYFVASDVLYAEHKENATWRRTTIGTLATEGERNDEYDWRGSLSERTSRVSPNGEWLTFMSMMDLTGYNNRDALQGRPDEEVYLYNANTNRLLCASCEPTGALPIGVEVGQSDFDGASVRSQETMLAATLPGWVTYDGSNSVYQDRYLSNSGRLFFNSYDALVPQDVNGTWDVYEYEPPAVGNCATSSVTFSERADGCVDLISAGTSAEQSVFVDASESGGDVFFTTTSQLSPQDLDNAIDVYDAHECTQASPCPPVPTTPPPCDTGDACKSAPTPQPTLFGAPASETFSGAGNIIPVPPPAVKPKPLTQAQKLAKALKACRKQPKKRRAACQAQARKRYRAQKSAARKSLSTGKGR